MKSYGQDTDFSICVRSDLELEDIILGQGHDTPFGKDNNFVKYYQNQTLKYGPDKDHGYACNETLTLEIRPWVMVGTHAWVMDND